MTAKSLGRNLHCGLYPDANNPNSTGYYDYDKIRRVEVRIRLLFDKDEEGVKDFCCYSEE